MHTDRSSQYSIAGFLIVLGLALAIAAPRFFDLATLADLATTTSMFAIVGIGALMVIATGNIDVSAGPIYAIAGVSAAAAAANGSGPMGALLTAAGVGIVLGAVNALLVTVLQVPSIIATLGTSSLFTGGLVFITNGGLWIVGLPEQFTWLGQGNIAGISVPIVLSIVVLLVAWYVLTKTPAGRRVMAVGSNPEAARLAGIRVKAVEGSTFIINGALLGIAATLAVARLGQAQTNLGASVTITAITIAVVGGVSVFGGTGTVLGIVLSSALVAVTSSALTFFHFDPLWSQMLQGLFILAALTISVLQRRRPGSFLRMPVALQKVRRVA